MEISAMGLESSLGPQLQQPDETMKDILGSSSVKQERPGSEEDAQKSSKIPRTDDDLNLLCFSLQDKWGGLGLFGGLRPQNTTALPAYYSFASGAFNSNVHAPFTGVRSPFTPTQWVELELQALIYKHLVAKMPVPSSLLLPIKKSFYPYGSSGSSAGTLTSNSMGWGPFHQGLGRKSDPEPGRCRRTDGKKWRCSRDAVPEQKYCDRHINRGRHRSRKHVEGQQPGYSLSGFSNTKMAPMATQIISSGGAASGHSSAPHQFQASHYIASGIPSPSAFISGIGDCQSLSALSSDFSLSPRNASFYTIGEQNPIMELPQYDFQFLSDSLINPSQQTPSYISSTSSYNALMEFSDQEANDQFPFFQLFEDWPKDQSNCSTISWPEELKSDWNPLSVSTSMKSDFSSSSFSPVYEKASLSPLRLSYDFDPIQMNSIANNDFSELFQKPKKSVPASCASSMGDPLGEVLKICDSKFKSCYGSPSSLNAVKEWDGANRNMKFSPTSVLQYAPLCSLSNSSSASSPRDGNKKTPEGGSHCEDVMASNVVALWLIEGKKGLDL